MANKGMGGLQAARKGKGDSSLRYKMHVKKGDTVQVIAGSDKGKVGEIVRTLPKLSKVIVKGVNVKTKHVKPQQEGESGQIVTLEYPIHSSNVMLYSTKQKVVSRVCYTFGEDGRKVRMLTKTKEILD
jgi:large subunit ribosomal protein L24